MKIKMKSGGSKGSGPGGKVFLSLFLSIFFCAGVFVGWMMFKDFRRTLSTHSWPAAPCRIVSSDVEVTDSNDDPYLLTVEYVYSIAGKEYTSTLSKEGDDSFDNCSKAWRLKCRYDAGTEHLCFVDPSNPSHAVLRLKSLWSVLMFLLPAIFMLVGGGGVYLVWVKGKRGGSAKTSISEKASGGKNVGLIVSGVFLILGAILGYFLGVRPIRNLLSSRRWAETPCVIEGSAVRSHSSDDGTTYSVDICYRYDFKGKTYKSNRYGFIGGSSSGHKGKRAIVKKYRKGSTAACYVNPRDPFEAALNRSGSPIYLLALIPLLFFAIGVFGLISVHRKKSGKSVDDAEALPDWLPEMKQGRVENGEIVLKTSSRLGKFIGVTIFALIWNSFVVFMLVLRSKGEGPPIIFPIIFGAVGVIVLGAVVHSLLAMFNPRPTVTLSVADVVPGQEFDLAWRFSGATGRIGTLRITLELREEATYRRGTNTYTDKNIIESAEIVDLTDKREFGSGACTIGIPVGAMHSFEASNNKLIWAIKLHGDIKFWPDVSEEYKMRVRPEIKS